MTRRKICAQALTTNIVFLNDMLIINSDDWGENRASTDNSLFCFNKGRITSASAMVFMEDSQRAAELALEAGVDAGLHLNFTTELDGDLISSKIIECQHRIASFLKLNKYCSLFYNPFIRRDFEYVYKAQYEEYVHLYHKSPTHIDGHHHMHLCTNMLVDRLIPSGSIVRRSFAFSSGEKNIFNRFYRRVIGTIIKRRYTCTDLFFSIEPHQKAERLQNIVNLSKFSNVELMVHPERKREFDYLMSEEYFQLISQSLRGTYGSLQ
jgi:chitin disaccharide deacetylase